jgi:hypothetical protein
MTSFIIIIKSDEDVWSTLIAYPYRRLFFLHLFAKKDMQHRTSFSHVVRAHQLDIRVVIISP